MNLSLENYRDLGVTTLTEVGSDTRVILIARTDCGRVLTEEYAVPSGYSIDDAHEHSLVSVIDVRSHESVDAAMRYACGEVTRSLLVEVTA